MLALRMMIKYTRLFKLYCNGLLAVKRKRIRFIVCFVFIVFLLLVNFRAKDFSDFHFKFKTLSKMYRNILCPGESLKRSTKDLQQLYNKTCANVVTPPTMLQPSSFDYPSTQFPRTLLVVFFNWPRYESLPYVDLLYRPFFPLIVYCGPKLPKFDRFPLLFDSSRNLKYRFIRHHNSIKHFSGAFSYECARNAMRMCSDVDGYLVTADDALFFPNVLRGFNASVAWLPERQQKYDVDTMKECEGDACDNDPIWPWWERYRSNILNMFEFFENQTHSSVAQDCHRQLRLVSGGRRRLFGAMVDVYYIPRRLATQFVQLSQIMLRLEMFVEIAVQVMVMCLEEVGHVQRFPLFLSWDSRRFDPAYVWRQVLSQNAGKKVIHPMKWSIMQNATVESNLLRVFCNEVLPFLHFTVTDASEDM